MATGEQKGPIVMFLGGMISGGVGYGLSSPLWQAKTRLQVGCDLAGNAGYYRWYGGMQAGAGRVENGIFVTGLCKGMPQKHRHWGHVLGSIGREEGVRDFPRLGLDSVHAGVDLIAGPAAVPWLLGPRRTRRLDEWWQHSWVRWHEDSHEERRRLDIASRTPLCATPCPLAQAPWPRRLWSVGHKDMRTASPCMSSRP
jgi:hypothetical protein